MTAMNVSLSYTCRQNLNKLKSTLWTGGADNADINTLVAFVNEFRGNHCKTIDSFAATK